MHTFSHRLIRNIPIAVLMLTIALLSFSAAYAGEATPEIECEAFEGIWDGTSGPTADGTCTFPAGSDLALEQCGPGFDSVHIVVGGIFQGFTCVSAGSPPDPAPGTAPAPGPAATGKCKLLSIDSSIPVGANFSASWIGKLDSVRFRQPMAGTYFVPPIAGTVHFEDGHRAGDFSSFGLDRGRWEATCWGPAGTLGTAKIVFVK